MPYDQQYRQHMHWILSLTPIMTIGNWTKNTHAPTPRAFGIMQANHWDHETIRPLTSNTRRAQTKPLLWSCQRLVIKLKKKLCAIASYVLWLSAHFCAFAVWDQTVATRQQVLNSVQCMWNTIPPLIRVPYSEPIPSLFRAYSGLIPSLFRASLVTKWIKNETLFRSYSRVYSKFVSNLFQALLWNPFRQVFECFARQQASDGGHVPWHIDLTPSQVKTNKKGKRSRHATRTNGNIWAGTNKTTKRDGGSRGTVVLHTRARSNDPNH